MRDGCCRAALLHQPPPFHKRPTTDQFSLGGITSFSTIHHVPPPPPPPSTLVYFFFRKKLLRPLKVLCILHRAARFLLFYSCGERKRWQDNSRRPRKTSFLILKTCRRDFGLLLLLLNKWWAPADIHTYTQDTWCKLTLICITKGSSQQPTNRYIYLL